MKNLALTLCILFMTTLPLWTQDINIDPDSLYKEAPASEFEFSMLAHVWNNGNQNVTLRWDRNIEQIPNGWTTNFCDKNVCYSNFVSTEQFDLYANGDSSILKPIFRPNETPGTCIYRITLNSLTPGIVYSETVVFLAVATVVNGAVEVLSAKDVAIFPNPVAEMLTVAIADAGFKGSWTVTNPEGQVLINRQDAPATGELDISNLSAGLYFLNIRTEEGQFVTTRKFFVR